MLFIGHEYWPKPTSGSDRDRCKSSWLLLFGVYERCSNSLFQVRVMHNDTHSVVASLSGEMAAQSFAYRTHGTADSDKSCCYQWTGLCAMTKQQCMLARAPPPPQ